VYFSDSGSGAPLVLIHGIMADGRMFDQVAEGLRKTHRLIVPDLRGSGRSREMPPPYSAKQEASDIARLMDALQISVADVLGYSQGGAVAQQFAIDFPQRVRRLLLASTYAYNPLTVREKIEGHVVPFLVRVLGMRRFGRLVLSLGLQKLAADRAEGVLEMIASQDAANMIGAWKEAMAFDSRAHLERIRNPTLVLAGGQDKGVPLHHAWMLHAGIPGSQLIVVPDADHAWIWAYPERFVAEVESFLL